MCNLEWYLPPVILADTPLLLGDNLLPLLLLALGAAMAAGSVAALIRPPAAKQKESDLERAPRGRTLFFAVLGTVVAVWALASLVAG